jgi:hypothetical protein
MRRRGSRGGTTTFPCSFYRSLPLLLLPAAGGSPTTPTPSASSLFLFPLLRLLSSSRAGQSHGLNTNKSAPTHTATGHRHRHRQCNMQNCRRSSHSASRRGLWPFFRGHLLRMKGNGGNKWSAQCRRVTEIWGFHCHHGRIMVMDGLFPLTSIGGALGNAAGPGGAECSAVKGQNGRCTLLLPASAETSNFLHGRSNFSSFFGRIYIASSSTIFTSLGGIWNLDSDSYYAPEARLIDAFYLCR